MHIRSLMLLIVTISLAGPSSCGVSTGNIADLVATYEITITNAGSQDALIFIAGKDVKHRAVVHPGAATHATSFAGGTLLVGASPGVDVLGALKQRRDAIAAKLDVKPMGLADSIEIYNQLALVSAEIRHYESGQHGSLCSIDLKPDPTSGKGTNATGSATLDGDRWVLAC